MKNFEIITKRGSKCQAIVDGEKMRISLEAAAKVRLKEGPMDDDKFAEFCKLNDFCLCKKYLFDMVSRRSWTVAAAKNYLLGKGYAPESVDKAVNMALEYGYLSDEKYAENYVSDRFKATGELRLRRELKQRGISDVIVSETLGKADLGDEYERALELARKRTADREKKLSTPKAKERVLRYLIWRGFEYETARRVIEEISE